MPSATDEAAQPLLHIGYHKTATTWLQRCIFQDPKTRFGQIGGAQDFIATNPFVFRPNRIRKKLEPEIRGAQARNRVPVMSSERLSGDPYTGGYDSKAIADRLAAVYPRARILLVIREQKSMFVSIYKEYIMRGGAASFRQWTTPPEDGYWLPQFRFEFLAYHHLIGYYNRLFGDANVLVLPYELLQRQPRSFLQRLDEFAGTSAAQSNARPIRVSQSAAALSLKRHANRHLILDPVNPAPLLSVRGSNKVLVRLCREMDARIPAALRDRHDRRWRRYAERKIGDRYAKSNARTAKVTGLDLRAFGYACE